MTKLTRIQSYLQQQQIDFTVIQNPDNIRLLTTFASEPHERVLALFMFADNRPAILLVPALEHQAAELAAPHTTVISYTDDQNAWHVLRDHLGATFTQAKQLAAVEYDGMSVGHYFALQDTFPHTHFTKNISDFIANLRLIKTPDEIALLHEAGRWADIALHIGAKGLRKQPTELALVAEIEYELKRRGVTQMSFDTMVLSQQNAANPHGSPGQSVLMPNTFTLFDLGTMHRGYASDVTRTFFSGQHIPQDDALVYDTVLTAHLAALNAVKPGVVAGQLDRIARDIITDAGFGDAFTHRLGHGIGQSVHEYPSLTHTNSLILEPGMCFSIEPGIYLPGKIGVRIEDCLVVTETGFEVFTHTPKDRHAWEYLIDTDIVCN